MVGNYETDCMYGAVDIEIILPSSSLFYDCPCYKVDMKRVEIAVDLHLNCFFIVPIKVSDDDRVINQISSLNSKHKDCAKK